MSESFLDDVIGSLGVDDPAPQGDSASGFLGEVMSSLPDRAPEEPQALESPDDAPEPQAMLESPEPLDETPLSGHVARGVDQLQGLAYSAVEAAGEGLGSESISSFGREGRERNREEAAENPASQSFSEADSFGDYATWAKETVLSQAPMTAPAVIGAGTGALAGATLGPLGATVGGLVGAFIPSFVLGSGEVQQAIKETDADVVAPGTVFGAGAAIGALDSVFPGKMGAFLTKKFGKEIAEDIAQKALAKRLATEVPKSMTMEGVTEVVQSAISEAAVSFATGAPINWEEWKSRAIEEFAAGALMGGGISTFANVLPSKKPEAGLPPNQTQKPAPYGPENLSQLIDSHPVVQAIQDPVQRQQVSDAVTAQSVADGTMSRVVSSFEEGAAEAVTPEVEVYLSAYIRDAVPEILAKGDVPAPKGDPVPDTTSFGLNGEFPEAVASAQKEDLIPENEASLAAQMDAFEDGRKPAILITKGDPVPDTTSFGLNGEFPEAVASAQKEDLIPENEASLAAQMDAFEDGRKPAILITKGEAMPEIPQGAKVAEVPGRGQLIYRDEKTLEAAKNNQMGEALGLGIDEKPMTDQVVTARNSEGVVVTDTATDGRPEVVEAAEVLAGEGGSVEHRTVDQALEERTAAPNVSESFYDSVMSDLSKDLLRAQYGAPEVDNKSAKVVKSEPVSDTGKSVMTESIPVSDTGKSVMSESIPVSDTGKSVMSESIPVSDTGKSVMSESIPVSDTGKSEKGAKSDRMSRFMAKVARDAQMEAQGIEILEDAEDAGVTPASVSGEFWTDTYPKLNLAAQKKFQKYLNNLSGMQPGDVLAYDSSSGLRDVADTWEDLGAFWGEDLGPSMSDLEGSDRGYMSMMAWANANARKQHTPKKRMPETPKSISIKSEIDKQAHGAATSPTNSIPEPTVAQIEAGNYKKGAVKAFGLDIAVENPKGSTRSGVDSKGVPWENTLQHHYGYIRRSEGADGDAVDVFIGPKHNSEKAFIIDQKNENGKGFDEHKVVLGAETRKAAEQIYDANYASDWKGRGAVTEVSTKELKNWIASGDLKKPAEGQMSDILENTKQVSPITDLNKFLKPKTKSEKPPRVSAKKSTTPRSSVTDTYEEVTKLKGMQKLLDNGEVEIVQSVKDLPKKLQDTDAEGGYDPDTGKSYLVADSLKPEHAQSTVLHEMTHRMFMQNPDVQGQMVGEMGEFTQIFHKIEKGEFKGRYKNLYRAAMARIPDNTPQADRVEEFAAYVISEFNAGATLPAKLATWAKRVMARLKAGMKAVGVNLKGVSVADLDAMVRKTITQKEPINPHMERERALFSKAKKDLKAHWYSRPAGMSDIDQIRDQGLWTKARLLRRKWLAPEGNLDVKTYQLNTLRQGGNVAEDLEAKFLLKGFEKEVFKAYKHTLKSKLSVLDKATRRKLSDALKVPDIANMDPSIPEAVKVQILAMRQHIDKLSQFYVDLVREETVLGLQAATPALRRAVLGARLVAANSVEVEIFNADKPDGASPRRKKQKTIQAETRDAVKDLLDPSEDSQTVMAEAAKLARKLGTIDTITHNAGQYVLRSYRMHEDGGLWLKKMPQKVKDTAFDFVKQQMVDHNTEKGVSLTPEKLNNEVRKALESLVPKKASGGDSIASMIMSPKMGVDMQRILTHRKDIPVEIRDYLGEYHDAAFNYAHTVQKVTHLATSKQFFNEVEKLGVGEFLFKDEDRPSGASEPLGAEGSPSMGALAGYYTFPEVAEAFTEHMLPANLTGLLGGLVQLNSLMKINMTVYNPPTAFRNFVSAGGFTVMNGHFRPSKIKPAVRMGMAMLGAGGRKAHDYRKELSRLRVIGDGVRAGEVAQTFQDARIYHLANDEIGESATTVAANAGRSFVRKIKSIFEGIYLFGDDFWKVIGFEATVSDLMKYEGLTREEVAPIAANQIRNTYPTYSMVGKGTKTLARFPTMGMFVSFISEILRTTPNVIRQANHDWHNGMKIPAAKRATGILMMSAGIAASVTRARNMFGYDEEDDEAARVLGPEWMKNSTLMFLPRDEDGNMRYWDVSNTYAYNYYTRPIVAMLRDQPIGTRLREASLAMVTPFTGEEAGFKVLREMGTNQNEWGQKIYFESDDTFGSTFIPLAEHFISAAKPGFLKSQDRLSKGAEAYISGSGKQYSLSDEVWSFFGFRMTTVNPKVALFYKAYALADAKRDATQRMKRIAAKNLNDVPEEDIKQAWISANAIVYKAHVDLQTAIRSAEKLGLSSKNKEWVLSEEALVGVGEASGLSDEAIQIIRSKSISKADIAALDAGDIPLWKPSDRFFDGAIDKIHLIISDKDLVETIESRLEKRHEYMLDLQDHFETEKEQRELERKGLSVPDTSDLNDGDDLSSVLLKDSPKDLETYLSKNPASKDVIIQSTKEISPAWADMIAQAPPDSVLLLKHVGVLS